MRGKEDRRLVTYVSIVIDGAGGAVESRAGANRPGRGVGAGATGRTGGHGVGVMVREADGAV